MCVTVLKDKLTSAEKCMAKKSPVTIWITRHRPSREPKFHSVEILEGVGRSTRAPFRILIRGWVFRIFIISFLLLDFVVDLLFCLRSLLLQSELLAGKL